MGRKILTYLAILAGILAFSGLFIVLFANSLSLHCVRPVGQNPVCKITRSLLGRVPLSTRVIPDVVDVQQDRSCDSDCSYRALLITSSGESVPVNDVFTDPEPVRKQMAEIRAFLDGTAPSFDYTEDVPWWVLALTVGLGLMGVVIVLISLVADLVKR